MEFDKVARNPKKSIIKEVKRYFKRATSKN
jgi:hypothetical protein